MFRRFIAWLRPTPPLAPKPKPPRPNYRRAAARVELVGEPARYQYPIQPPVLAAGVVPANTTAPVVGDSNPTWMTSDMLGGSTGGFPGYPYLAQLAARAEFRRMATALASEMTRKWVEFESTDADSGDQINEITAEFKRLGVQAAIRRAVELDAFFGRAQIFVEIDGAARDKPLILDPRTIKLGAFKRIQVIEPIWSTPAAYDTTDPTAPNFYSPQAWWVMGKEIHATRLLSIITQPMPDILKAAHNFSGMSLSQMAEPYVDNWLKVQKATTDLVVNFSTTALATDMSAMLTPSADGLEDAGGDLLSRAKLFTANRTNQGLMMIDKGQEELIQLNTPLSGLSDLQSQAQVHKCAVSRIPEMILTGVSPSGLNASGADEIRAFYDWVHASQESHLRPGLETILQLVQLSLYGKINPAVTLKFVPLMQLDEVQEAAIRLSESQVDCAYIDHGVLAPESVAAKLESDPKSGYV